MPLKVIAAPNWGKALHGYPIREVHTAIALVTAENYLGPNDRPGPIVEGVNGWRVDRQLGAADEANIQVQRNGITGEPSTVAQALVPTRYHYALGGADVANHQARVAELTGKIQEALNRSLRSHRIGDPRDLRRTFGSFVQPYSVAGDFSA